MQNPPSPLDTLRQLKEMLDAGALTPAEFEALKQRLVFEAPTNAPTTTAPAPPQVPVVAPPIMPAASAYSAPIPILPEDLPASAVPYETGGPAPVSAELLPSEPERVPQSENNTAWEPTDFLDSKTSPTRSPLALVLSIGGVLVFLALVAYLSFNRQPSERISSTSMTAADSAATVIETGPQAAPLAPTTVPETLRVTPTNPAPSTPARPAPTVLDSAAAPAPATVADSVAVK